VIPDIVHAATYPYSPDLVWRAIATPEALGTWLMPTDFRDATPGHRFRFTDRPRPFWDGICECEVIEADAPRRFALRWGLNVKGAPSTVSWTLSPADEGTRVEFRHAGLSGVMGWFMKKGMDKGWRRMLDRSLPVVLAGLAHGQLPSRDEVVRTSRAR
jgi:uncharacterized protein YndB with AHSA1/START domain